MDILSCKHPNTESMRPLYVVAGLNTMLLNIVYECTSDGAHSSKQNNSYPVGPEVSLTLSMQKLLSSTGENA